MNPDAVVFRRRAFPQMTPDELHDVLKLRGDVFVVEQRIWQENDVDGLDPTAVHVLGRESDGTLVATARMHLEDSPVRVSRVVVARSARGQGVGAALMHYVGRHVGSCNAVMSAQAALESFYARFGWVREGEPYDEVGIPHLKLVRCGPAGRDCGEEATNTP